MTIVLTRREGYLNALTLFLNPFRSTTYRFTQQENTMNNFLKTYPNETFWLSKASTNLVLRIFAFLYWPKQALACSTSIPPLTTFNMFA